MDFGALTAGFVTGLREGVEAALIVAIVLAYLVRSGTGDQAGRVWLGAGLAAAVSLAAGVVIFQTVGSFQAPYEQYFEAGTLLVAATVVTWMLFWMRRTSANIRGELQAGIERALSQGSVFGLSALAFTAVIREGVETALFLLGQVTAATQADAGAASTIIGALAGLAAAAAIGFGFYRGARVINLRAFFRWTGIGLVFVAAGLVANAMHELVEVDLIPFGTTTAFDISGALPHESASGNVLGQVLHAVLGYSSTPEWIMVVAWAAYLVSVLALFLRPLPPEPAPVATSEQRPAST